MHVLVIGAGYTGRRIARAHLARGDDVTVSSRGTLPPPEGAEHLPLDLDAAHLPAQPRADRVYYTVPPPDHGVTDPRLERLLGHLPPPAHFTAFGTTGVYGNQRGLRVTEETPLSPTNDRARRRVAAENVARTWAEANCAALAILRVAGIYGPGRLPLERLRRGEPVPDAATGGPGNRIHVDDLVRAAVAIADARETGPWNVSDGNPLSVAAFHDLVADLAGLPRPRRVPADSAEISAGWQSFLRDQREVDNAKLLRLRGFHLLYEEVAEGIHASLRDVDW